MKKLTNQQLPLTIRETENEESLHSNFFIDLYMIEPRIPFKTHIFNQNSTKPQFFGIKILQLVTALFENSQPVKIQNWIKNLTKRSESEVNLLKRAKFSKKTVHRVTFWSEKFGTCQILELNFYNVSHLQIKFLQRVRFYIKKLYNARESELNILQRVRLWNTNFTLCHILNQEAPSVLM